MSAQIKWEVRKIHVISDLKSTLGNNTTEDCPKIGKDLYPNEIQEFFKPFYCFMHLFQGKMYSKTSRFS